MRDTGPIRILYVGDDAPGATSRDRAEALIRNGYPVTVIPTDFSTSRVGRLDRKISVLCQQSLSIMNINRLIATHLKSGQIDLLWIDKGWMIYPSTLRLSNRLGVKNILFNNDNPWGFHERGKWRHLYRSLRYFDDVFSPRVSTNSFYKRGGAQSQTFVDFGYDPFRHVPSGGDKIHDVCFVGTALPDGGGVRPHRAEVLIQVMEQMPGRVSIFGHGWGEALGASARLARVVGPPQMGADYARTISASHVSLAFITHDNSEESSHKAFEIAACGGVLLAERSPRLCESFKPDVEAVFFSSSSELVSAAKRLLDAPDLGVAIGVAARRRAVESGYDNDSRLARAFMESSPLQELVRS